MSRWYSAFTPGQGRRRPARVAIDDDLTPFDSRDREVGHPMAAGTPRPRARMAIWEDPEPVVETIPARSSRGTSAICIALSSSPTRMVPG